MSAPVESSVLSINLSAVRHGRVIHDGTVFRVAEGAEIPAASMDGQALAYLRDEGLIEVGADGGVELHR